MGSVQFGIPVLDLWFGGTSDDDTSDSHVRGDRARSSKEHAATATTAPLSQTDSAIVARLHEGDESAFDALFREYFARLTDFATATVGDSAVAEELAADVFVSLWRRRATWEPRGSIAAYLYRAVRNLARNHVRDRTAEHARYLAAAAEIESTIEAVSIDQLADREARLAAVWRAVDQLPETRRAVVHLRWRANMSFEEIAVLLHTSPAAVKMQLSRALKTVRELLPNAFD
jgi:RNA polymerase sigma-70 factor (ECF subfamily)